jgi:hypothetical protein
MGLVGKLWVIRGPGDGRGAPVLHRGFQQ